MALDWTAVVGQKTLEDGGKTGDMLTLLFAHLEEAKAVNGLTAEEVGALYGPAIPGVINAAINFEIQAAKWEEEQKTVQTQRYNDAQKALLSAVAEYGYDSATIDATGKVTLGDRSENGIVTKQEDKLDQEINLLQSQELSERLQIENVKEKIEAEFGRTVAVDYANSTFTNSNNVDDEGTIERQLKIAETQLKLSKIPSTLKS